MPCFLANDNAVPQTCCPSVGSPLNQLDARVNVARSSRRSKGMGEQQLINWLIDQLIDRSIDRM